MVRQRWHRSTSRRVAFIDYCERKNVDRDLIENDAPRWRDISFNIRSGDGKHRFSMFQLSNEWVAKKQWHATWTYNEQLEMCSISVNRSKVHRYLEHFMIVCIVHNFSLDSNDNIRPIARIVLFCTRSQQPNRNTIFYEVCSGDDRSLDTQVKLLFCHSFRKRRIESINVMLLSCFRWLFIEELVRARCAFSGPAAETPSCYEGWYTRMALCGEARISIYSSVCFQALPCE